MANIADALRGMISAEQLTQLTNLLAKDAFESVAPDTVTVGAISVATPETYLSIDGTKAFTLANGTFVGQRKTCIVTVGANTPIGTITPASVTGFATVTALGDVGDFAEFIWNGTAWRLGTTSGVTIT